MSTNNHPSAKLPADPGATHGSPDRAAMQSQQAQLSERLLALSSTPDPDLALPSVVQLRFVLLAAEALLLLRYGPLELAGPWLFAAVAAWTVQLLANGWLLMPTSLRRQQPQHLMGVVCVLDVLAFSCILAATGGASNPFSICYLVLITLSAVLLHQAWTWCLGGLAAVCYGALFWLPGTAPVGSAGIDHAAMDHAAMKHAVEGGYQQHLTEMWVAFLVAAGIITFFIARVSHILSQRQKEVLRLQRELASHERLASIAALAAGAAHEINTPLGTIAVAAREMERVAVSSHPDVAEDARLIRAEVDRCRRIVERMSLRGGELAGEALRTVQLETLIQCALDELPDADRPRVRVTIHHPDVVLRLPLIAAAKSLGALLQNAVQAAGAREDVTLTASVSNGRLEFHVQNQGPGLDAAALQRIGEPFYSTKAAAEGMGLGAYLARLFAMRMGGNLEYFSSPGQGVTALLTLRTGKERPW
ncbi:MAG: HAMP domain-containing histidine kinase [Bryobacterales bacterium]|nr:HAMP domain-containing histidine kinase [Bryobacterales bacterium]